MGEAVQLIYDEQSVELPRTYTIPPGLDLEVSSVVARVNGAVASGDFLTVLEVLSQDDKVMARVRIDQEYAVGDTGVNTWAPFLRRAQAASDGGQEALPFARFLRDTAFSLGGAGIPTSPFVNGAGTTIETSTEPTLPYFEPEIEFSGPDDWAISIYEPGLYGARLMAEFSGGTYYRGARINWAVKQATPGWAVGRHPVAWTNVAVGTLSRMGVTDVCLVTQEDIDDFAQEPNVFPELFQTSGANVNVTAEFQFFRLPFAIA